MMGRVSSSRPILTLTPTTPYGDLRKGFSRRGQAVACEMARAHVHHRQFGVLPNLKIFSTRNVRLTVWQLWSRLQAMWTRTLRFKKLPGREGL